jgi:hypothetical protein
MSEDLNSVNKYFTSAFLLDRAKLTRILNIMEDRFKEAEMPFEPTFEVIHCSRALVETMHFSARLSVATHADNI